MDALDVVVISVFKREFHADKISYSGRCGLEVAKMNAPILQIREAVNERLPS